MAAAAAAADEDDDDDDAAAAAAMALPLAVLLLRLLPGEVLLKSLLTDVDSGRLARNCFRPMLCRVTKCEKMKKKKMSRARS